MSLLPGDLKPSKTLMGHSQDENQVSNTSSSCLKFCEPQRGHFPGLVSETIASRHSGLDASMQYHAGIRCPHHNWREMHQSCTFSIQWRYVFIYFSGISFIVPSSTCSNAGFEILSIFKNHCMDSLGSITASVRSE